MFVRLLLLFTVVPFVELVLLLWLADQIHWTWTLLLVLATGVVGAALARWQGFVTLQRLQSELASGQPPAATLVDGLLILVAGALLVTPGVLTDGVGFLLLVPAARAWIRQRLRRRFEAQIQIATLRGSGQVVDAVDPESDPF